MLDNKFGPLKSYLIYEYLNIPYLIFINNGESVFVPGDDMVTIFTNIWKDKWILVDYFKPVSLQSFLSDESLGL